MKKIKALLLMLAFLAFTICLLACDNAPLETSTNQTISINTQNFSFEKIDDNAYTVSKYTGADSDLTIPSTYLNLPVVAISKNAFKDNQYIIKLTIPSCIKQIGEDAFSYCDNLSKVNYTGTIDEWVQIEFMNFFSNPVYCTRNLYINNTLVTEATLTSATYISSNAFFGCESLKTLIIENNTNSIGDNAFSYCVNLNNLKMGNNITTIGEGAFYGCNSLTNIIIPNSVTSIDDYAFYDCPIERATIPVLAIKSIINSKFNLTKNPTIKEITLTSGETIESNAFSQCSNLSSVIIGNSITSIGNGAFSNCNKLTNITIFGDVTSIGDSAFSDCSSLTTIIIPPSATYIGNSAFLNCSSLATITIPQSVTFIGYRAFYGCNNLTNVKFINTNGWYYYESHTSVKGELFKNTNLLDTVTAANYLTLFYSHYFWKCY